ncbi:hypothetical protein [Gardnerella vaginalis]|uniref:hypothetical protein n=1 Tax=Gardnerella vaginalis TaxID=2702 RepID=UPI0039F095E9
MVDSVDSVDSVKDPEDVKNNEKSMLMLNDAARSAAKLTELWPLTEARHLDNDAKYAENLEVRSMRAIARILTNLDVTVPDAEFVYEGADEIPGRPQEIVDALLAAADAYDNMDSCYEPNYDEAEEEILENSNNINSVFSKIASHSAEDSNAINAAADTLNVEGNWSINDIDFAINYAKQMVSCYENKSLETQKIIVVLSLLTNLIKKTNEICETLPIFLYINEICECAGLPRMMFKDAQWREIVDCVRNSRVDCSESNENSISALINFVSPLLAAEWQKHREDVLWDPEVAKKLAKEEDDRKSREALAAKFAHVEGNKESTQALD